MACNRNGRTDIVSLTPIVGGTAANANYLLALNFHTCGNRKLCTQEMFPVTSNLSCKVLGTPVSIGNGTYCCDVLVSGTVTYMPYVYGCNCNVCPRTDNIYTTICVPCSSAVAPTVTVGDVVANPTGTQPCYDITNEIAITTSINVTTA